MKKVSERIVELMEQNHISAQQVAEETRIDIRKLTSPCEENLTAGEFLDLCEYLNIRPEEMR